MGRGGSSHPRAGGRARPARRAGGVLRPDAIPETATIDAVFGLHGRALGITREAFTEAMRERTLLKRLPTLDDVASAALFLASAGAGAMTGTVANLSGGSLVD